MGIMALVMQPSSVIAIRFLGEVRDRTGAYDVGFGAFIFLAVIAYFLVVEITIPKVDQADGSR